MKIFLAIVVCVVLGYSGLLLFIFLKQRQLQYFPSHRDREGLGADGFKPWRDPQGTFLGYWRPREQPRRVILFFHGNGGEALDRAWFSNLVPPADVLILAEYPGYGALPGNPTEDTLFRAAERLLSEIQKRWPQVPVTVVGESLGTGVACHLAAQPGVTQLALISPFSSALDVASYHYPFLPVKVLMRDRFQSLSAVQGATIPLHIVHGTQDEVIPISLARKLYEAYPQKNKAFTELPGYGHNNLSDAIMNSPMAGRFRDFLSE